MANEPCTRHGNPILHVVALGGENKVSSIISCLLVGLGLLFQQTSLERFNY